MSLDKAQRILGKKERARAVQQLLDSDGWKQVLLPHLAERARHHARECCRRDSTPEKRAEHIEAVHLAESLIDLPGTIIATLESDIRQIAEGKK